MAVDQVGIDLSISIDPNSVSTVDFDQSIYNQLLHQIQSSLAVANSALASAEAAKNAYNIQHWQGVIADLNTQLAALQAGDY